MTRVALTVLQGPPRSELSLVFHFLDGLDVAQRAAAVLDGPGTTAGEFSLVFHLLDGLEVAQRDAAVLDGPGTTTGEFVWWVGRGEEGSSRLRSGCFHGVDNMKSSVVMTLNSSNVSLAPVVIVCDS